MISLDIDLALQKKMITHLMDENFINERRFAESFSRGKFRNNRWGKLKIRRALLAKKIQSKDIEYGLAQIDEAAYEDLLIELMESKMNRLKQRNLLVKRKKVADYLIGKGFEAPLVWDLLKAKFPG